MSVFDRVKKALLTRFNDLINISIVIAGKLGMKVALFHVYTLQSPEQTVSPRGGKNAAVIRHEISSSRPNEELLSIWDNGQRAGGLDMTRVSHYVNHIRSCVAFDGWYIYNLGINKTMRCHGYARGLVDEAVRTHPGERFYAMVAFTNFPSIRLVESYGFKRADPVIFIHIFGRTFRNSRSRKYLRPTRTYSSGSSTVDMPSNRPL